MLRSLMSFVKNIDVINVLKYCLETMRRLLNQVEQLSSLLFTILDKRLVIYDVEKHIYV